MLLFTPADVACSSICYGYLCRSGGFLAVWLQPSSALCGCCFYFAGLVHGTIVKALVPHSGSSLIGGVHDITVVYQPDVILISPKRCATGTGSTTQVSMLIKLYGKGALLPVIHVCAGPGWPAVDDSECHCLARQDACQDAGVVVTCVFFFTAGCALNIAKRYGGACSNSVLQCNAIVNAKDVGRS